MQLLKMHLVTSFKLLTSVNRVGFSCLKCMLPVRQKACTNRQSSFRNGSALFSTSGNFVNTSSPMIKSWKKCISFDKEHISAHYLIFVRSKSTIDKTDKSKERRRKPTNENQLEVGTDQIKIIKETDIIQLFSVEDLLIGKHTLNEAREYAKKEGMRLVRLQGKTANIPPSYKLVTSSMFRDEMKKERRKSIKQFIIRGNIDEHDLVTKIGQMIKFLNKGTSVEIKFEEGKRQVSFASVLKKIGEQLDHVAYIKKSSAVGGRMEVVFVPRENLNQDTKDDS